jgi:hypothetical protein
MRVLKPDNRQRSERIDGPLQLQQVRDGLAIRRLGTNLHYFSEIDSTNSYALYFSVILRPQLPPVHAPQLTLMAAVALADTIASFIGTPPSIKWPNDILVGGKKLAGILTESSCDSERIEFVILGIGVNLNYPVPSMPEVIRERRL